MSRSYSTRVKLWRVTLGSQKEAYIVKASSSWLSKSFLLPRPQDNTNSLKSTVPSPFLSNTGKSELEKQTISMKYEKHNDILG